MKLIDRLIKIDRFKINVSYALGHFFYNGNIIFETYDKFDIEFENIYLDRDMKIVLGKDSKCVKYCIRRKDTETYIFKRFSVEKLDNIMLEMISGAIVIGPNIDETLFDNLGPVYIGWKSVKIEEELIVILAPLTGRPSSSLTKKYTACLKDKVVSGYCFTSPILYAIIPNNK